MIPTNSETPTDTKARSGPECDHYGYSTCFITYLDILGFRAGMHGSGRAEDSANKLMAFRNICEGKNERELPKVETENQSYPRASRCEFVVDAAFRARNAPEWKRDLTFLTECLRLCEIALECIKGGLLLRGAMDFGPVNFSEESSMPLFGPAAVCAFELETKVAKFPRIIVSRQAVLSCERAKESKERDEQWKRIIDYLFGVVIKVDSDGQYFLDYLSVAKDECRNGRDRPKAKDFLLVLQAQSQMYNSSQVLYRLPEVRAKHEWLREYHNMTVSALSESERSWLEPIVNEIDGLGSIDDLVIR